MKAIFRRELHGYFRTVTGYLFAALMLAAAGIYTISINVSSGYTNFEYVLYNMSFIYLLVVPLLTMRSISGEHRQSTDKLLYSAPVKMGGVVVGKYFAMLAVLAVPVLICGLYPLIYSFFGKVNLLTAYASLLAFFLLGAALCAVGLFISSLTDNPLIAAVLIFVAMLFIYLSTGLGTLVTASAPATLVVLTLLVAAAALLVLKMTKSRGAALIVFLAAEAVLAALYFLLPSLFVTALSDMLTALSLFDVFVTFMYGTLDLTVLLYYVSFAALFVFLAVQSVEKRRWS